MRIEDIIMQKILWTDVERAAKKNFADLIMRCENHFKEQIKVVADEIYGKRRTRIILVAGPSSSGKTTFSRLLNDELQEKGVKVHYIGMDDFFIDREKVPFLSSGVRDFDSPVALDMPLLNEVVGGVLRSEWVEIPEYDFLKGERKKEKTFLRLHDEDVVIIEGIHALNPAVIGNNDSSDIVKISIKPRKTYVMPSGKLFPPDELRLLRRTIRDFYTRGYDLKDTSDQWDEVLKAERKYITPYTDYADYFIDSAFDYELFIYKQCVGDALDDCHIAKYADIKEVLGEVSLLPKTEIPKTSLLNEFAISSDSQA